MCLRYPSGGILFLGTFCLNGGAWDSGSSREGLMLIGVVCRGGLGDGSRIAEAWDGCMGNGVRRAVCRSLDTDVLYLFLLELPRCWNVTNVRCRWEEPAPHHDDRVSDGVSNCW